MSPSLQVPKQAWDTISEGYTYDSLIVMLFSGRAAAFIEDGWKGQISFNPVIYWLICKFLLVNLQFGVSWFLRLCSQQKRSPHHLRLVLSILLQDWLDGLWVDRRDGSWHNTAISKPHMAARHLGKCQSMGQREHGVSEKLYNTEGKRWAADAFKYHLPLELESSGRKTCQKYKYVTEMFGDLKGLSSQVTCILHSQISRTSSKAFSWFYTDEGNEMQVMCWVSHSVRFASPSLAICQDGTIVSIHDRSHHILRSETRQQHVQIFEGSWDPYWGANLKDLLLATIGQNLAVATLGTGCGEMSDDCHWKCQMPNWTAEKVFHPSLVQLEVPGLLLVVHLQIQLRHGLVAHCHVRVVKSQKNTEICDRVSSA